MTNDLRIIAALQADPRRDIYEAAQHPSCRQGNGEFWISYQGGGPFQKSAVMALVESGILVRKYETGECYELRRHE